MHQLLILRKQSPVIIFVLLYIAADLVFISKDIYILNLMPFVLLLVYLALARIDLVYFLIVLLTPLSVQFIEFLPSSPLDFAIPTEPILFGVLILLLYRSVQHGLSFHQVLRHPVSYAILFNLIWILVTSLTSTMPLVSFKFLLARIWFVAIYFWLAIMVFKRNPRYIFWFIWCYAIPMVLVIFYTVYRHLGFGLTDKEAAHFVMNPFFRDHTSYGAILAMLFFSLGGVVLIKKRGLLLQGILLGTWLLISAALILSYTRAAWISVLVALAVLGFTLFRIRFRYILIVGILAALYLTSQRTAIVQKMERNRQVSSATFSEHVQSISNITTDESNLERINRWNSALRMFRERPVFGWGPGTYMFKYAPFQVSAEKTGISTDFGNLGNAHSEYIGPLAESGLLGSLSFLLIGILTLLTGFRVYSKVKGKSMKWMVLGLVLGYITYLVHGMLNNFLDTDKASALFWGFTAAFVSLDISLKELDPQN